MPGESACGIIGVAVNASGDAINSSAPTLSVVQVLSVFVVALCPESLRSSKLKKIVSQTDAVLEQEPTAVGGNFLTGC